MKNIYTDDKPKTIEVDYKVFNKGKTQIYSPLEDKFFNLTLQEIAVEEIYKPKKKGKICVDLGANIGLASLYLKNWFDKVYAVEPVELYYDALVKNTKKYKNIETHNHAISIVDTQGMFFSSKGVVPQSFHGLRGPEHNHEKVRCLTMETFMDNNEIDIIDFLKVDIEGAEYEVFFDKSFENVADRIRYIVGEAHIRRDGGGHPSSLPYILKEYGYKFNWKDLPENNYWYMPKYTNKATGVSKSVKVPMWTIFEAIR